MCALELSGSLICGLLSDSVDLPSLFGSVSAEFGKFFLGSSILPLPPRLFRCSSNGAGAASARAAPLHNRPGPRSVPGLSRCGRASV